MTNLVVAGAMGLGAMLSRRLRAPALAVLALLPVLDAIVVCLYVFGEDSYRDNGMSRWDAYRSPGGALRPMFVLSLVLLAAAAALLAVAALGRSRRLFGAVSLATALVCLFLVTPTILGFSLN